MNTIEINTTQKVIIEYELAAWHDRLFATLIDLFLISICTLFINSFFSIAFANDFSTDSSSSGQSYYLLTSLFPLFIFFGYHFFSELLMSGQSIGKKAIGIKVIKLNGQKATASDYLLRSIFHIVDTIFSVYVLGSLFIISSNKNQRLGDLAANTAVIRINFNHKFSLQDILNIDSISAYEPQHPEVKQFTEKDMLLIKNVIIRHRNYPNEGHQNAINTLVRDLMLKLDIVNPPKDKVQFLKTLIKDYIVLTR